MEVRRNIPAFPMCTVVKATGTEASRIRYWERKYDMLRPVRDINGSRLYTQEQIDLIKQISALADDKGVSLVVIKDLIGSTPNSMASLK
jgi:DNA-binding transcriptional MerR regulator